MYIVIVLFWRSKVEETYTKEETKELKVGMAVAIIMALLFVVNYLTKDKVDHLETPASLSATTKGI